MQNFVGIAQNMATNNTVTRCHVAHNQLEGITVDCSSHQCQILNNQVGHHQAGSGAAFRSTCKQQVKWCLQVIGNGLRGGVGGIGIDASDGAHISGNESE